MKSKRGLELPWQVLIPFIILALLLVLYLIFSGTAGGTITSAMDRIKSLFRFG